MLNILIVDDEYIMRQGLRYMISWNQEGYQIVGEAGNGIDALQCIEQTRPHIILCDIVMPLMDGIDFIQTVHNRFPNIQIIVLSGHDKFDFVRQALLNGASDYILKPSLSPQSLLQSLRNVSRNIPDYDESSCTETQNLQYRLERYLLGQDAMLSLSNLPQGFLYDTFLLYALDVKTSYSQKNGLANTLFQKINRFCSDISHTQAFSFLLNEQIACVLLCCQANCKTKIENNLQELTQQLCSLCPDIFAVTSDFFSNLSDIYPKFHEQISPRLLLAFYYPNCHFASCAHIVCPAAKRIKFDFLLYNSYLDNHQLHLALKVLQNYCIEACQQLTNPQHMKGQIKNAIYHLLDCISLQEQQQEELRRELFEQVEQIADSQSLLDWIENLSQTLPVSYSSTSAPDQRMEAILAYINENYAQELKLEDLALRFNFNYSYLSTYFTAQMNKTFTDYLNHIRIQHACQLLSKNQYSISEISQNVGYSEHSYFCRVFRKLTGKTPSAWRNSLNEK